MSQKTLRLMGKKKGMMQHFTEDGAVVPCTVIELEPNVILQVKTEESDGYNAIQLGFDKRTAGDARTIEKRTGKPLSGHFKKAGAESRRFIRESRLSSVDGYEVGQELTVSEFENIKFIDVTGTSKGKGFQGSMKRHGFKGGPGSHGSGFQRAPGSQGMRTTPGRVFKNKKNAGRMGGEKVTVEGLELLEANPDKNYLVVKGSVPGPVGCMVMVRESLKRNK